MSTRLSALHCLSSHLSPVIVPHFYSLLFGLSLPFTCPHTSIVPHLFLLFCLPVALTLLLPEVS